MNPTHNDVLAVVSQSGPTVTFFDTLTYDRLGEVAVPAEPHELCFDTARRRLYCTITYRSGYYHANSGPAREIVVIDPDERRVTGVVGLAPEWAPHGIALDPAGALLWVSVEAHGDEEGALVALDADTLRPVRRVAVGAPGPHWFTLTPDGSHAYTANKEAPFVSVVDVRRGTLAGRVDMPGGTEGITVSGDGRHVYAASPKGSLDGVPVRDAGVRVIDTATGEVVRTLPTDGVVFPVHMTSTGLLLAGELRMAPGGSEPGGAALGAQAPGVLHVHGDAGRHARIPVGAFPLTITSSPDGRYAYVSAVVSSTVTVVDLVSESVVTTLTVARTGEPGAHGLAYVPAAPARAAAST
ncbi:YncE family protein [Streptomyces sp. NPDC016309]|uniref:YncE family protein n=1 Tax=Streptomyces sp. NPDC016309 TaxID=3364965 RepID=UPI0036FE3EC7